MFLKINNRSVQCLVYIVVLTYMGFTMLIGSYKSKRFMVEIKKMYS